MNGEGEVEDIINLFNKYTLDDKFKPENYYKLLNRVSKVERGVNKYKYFRVSSRIVELIYKINKFYNNKYGVEYNSIQFNTILVAHVLSKHYKVLFGDTYFSSIEDLFDKVYIDIFLYLKKIVKYTSINDIFSESYDSKVRFRIYNNSFINEIIERVLSISDGRQSDLIEDLLFVEIYRVVSEEEVMCDMIGKSNCDAIMILGKLYYIRFDGYIKIFREAYEHIVSNYKMEGDK